jgi:hypothetical protein
MMRMTNVSIELITDIEKYLFFEQSVRGGVSVVPRKYSKANNPLLDDYNPLDDDKYILYYDCVNLYGYIMQQALPISDFEWMTDKELSNIDIMGLDDEGDTGFVFQVTLSYPSSLHDHHNDFALGVEKIKVSNEMLSPFSLNLKQDLGLKGTSEKLIPNLMTKDKYILHYKNLKFYMEQGLVLETIHRGMKFKQTKWLKPYIDFNSSMRAQATDEFSKSFWKLLCNSLYGKCLQNPRSYRTIELLTDDRLLRKRIAKSNFKRFQIFHENLVAVEFSPISIYLNRPVFAGFSILDLSKLTMADFHYNFIKRECGDKVSLLLSDTDSMIYEFTNIDPFDLMTKHEDWFDFSNLDKSHKLYSKKHEKCPGKFKIETGSKLIKEYVGLKPKMYSILFSNDKSDRRAKGIGRSVTKKELTHEKYVDCLFNNTCYHSTMQCIRCINHELKTQSITKSSLSMFDDKYYFIDRLHSLSYGHFKIKS